MTNQIDISQFSAIKDLIPKVRAVVRSTIDMHFSKVIHDESRREYESIFFKEYFQILAKKWIFEILWELEVHNGLHFNEITRHIPGISTRSLSERLKGLVKINLIQKSVQATTPPSNLYSLTDKGKGIVEISLLMWIQMLI